MVDYQIGDVVRSRHTGDLYMVVSIDRHGWYWVQNVEFPQFIHFTPFRTNGCGFTS